MACFVYIVECKDKSLYTGITWNLRKRLLEHNSGLSISTKGKLPVVLKPSFNAPVLSVKNKPFLIIPS